MSGKAKVRSRAIEQPIVEKTKQNNSVLLPFSFGLLAIACMFVTAFHSILDKYGEGLNLVPIVFITLGITGLALWGVWVFYKNPNCARIKTNITTGKIVFILISAGFILRFIYILYTDVGVAGISGQERQHDVFYFNDKMDYFRHSSYVEWFYNNLSLPKVKPEGLNQYYHPPLHHFLSAMWMRLLTTLGVSYNCAVESIQILTLFYSSACMIIGAKILQFMKLKGIALILPLAVICFHPTLIIMSGSVNNDMLSVALAFGAIYATMVWYKKPTVKNIIVVALSIGGSMMSKLSGGLIAPAVAVVFLVVLIKNMKEKGVEKGFISMLPQFLIFAIICVPLGLWWQIRTATLFDVPLTYVPSLSETSSQFLGEYSVLERLFGMPFESIKNIFVVWDSNGFNYNEYSIFLALIKTAVFGEFTLFNIAAGNDLSSVGNIFCHLLFWSCVMLTAVAIWGVIYCFVKKKYIVDLTLTLMFVLVGVVILINYVKFCFDYPFTCTQNFRYCVPLLLVGATFTGNLYKNILKKTDTFSKIMKWAFPTCVALFCLSSTMVYILLGGV